MVSSKLGISSKQQRLIDLLEASDAELSNGCLVQTGRELIEAPQAVFYGFSS